MEQKQEGKRNSHVIRRAPFRLQWRLFAFFQPDTVLTTLTPLSPPFLPLFPHVVRDRPRTFTFAIPLRPRVLPPRRSPRIYSRALWTEVVSLVYYALLNTIWWNAKRQKRGNNRRILFGKIFHGVTIKLSDCYKDDTKMVHQQKLPRDDLREKLSLERIRAEILTQLGKHSNRSGNATLKSLKEKSKGIFIPSGPRLD